jgi:Zn-dependent peptidase ImmA (M78 family)
MIGLQALADRLQTRWKLGSWTIQVKEMPLSERIEDDGATVVHGRINYFGNDESATILINPDFDETSQRHTLYHEMMHLRLEGHDCNSYYERGLDLIAGELAK